MGRRRARLPSVLPQDPFLDWDKGFWPKLTLERVPLPHLLVNPQDSSLGIPTLNVEVRASARHHLYADSRRQAHPLSRVLWGGGVCLPVNGKGRGR